MTDWKPDVEHIVNNHTRKEMDKKALELNIDEPEGYPNKTELAERMKPLLEDEEEPEEEPEEENRPRYVYAGI